MTEALEIRSVDMSFGAVKALNGVSLSAAQGERIALLGHNGAGKTTLFRLALGFLKPDHGSIRVCGDAPGGAAARRATAYLPENVVFPKNLSGREIILLYARLKATSRKAAFEALDRVGLSDAVARRVGEYSKGMRQRLGLAIASLGAPKLILLDEPTSGLDPQLRAEFYGAFRKLSEAGAAVLFSSHTLNDINGNADRIIILKSGAVVGDGSEEFLRAKARLPTTIVLHVDPGEAEAIANRFGGRVNGAGAVKLVCTADHKVATLARVIEAGAALRNIDIHDPSLAEIYRAFSGKETSA
ncbi:MAG TPA: ABC transporter ATP-binding protein [Parvularculaceae bacterium]|nr:ABC transporter ATP-binding protein [Parvularculaceae bacterium]